MAIVRVREHVNPLSRKYQTPTTPPDWNQVFADPSLPLHLDIGCGRGIFLLKMAQADPKWNYLGLEIREPIVDQALEWRNEAGLKNLHYIFCNVSNSLQPILASLQPGTLARVSIQFPDPWFKRKHQKRRVVQPEIVATLAEFMNPGAIVFLQSDILDVAKKMVDRFAESPRFVREDSDWLPDNPLPIPTERELMVTSFGDPIYRATFRKSE
ncbi:tRNA (guanosine(46)-N7)-methyltransferase TrmB [Leptolyngbya sp. FACHB-17]|uniref:tRNA (guanosine(46)-N7)-methyltransferase TrmB n=1 Tax=unclassified Leptolyngbya TaxID=2650499 RepID=UPI0016808B40|nr:tRNA (guanosine(46)-N7)-methyltransferase TrmB [Leptolyngbya sp. FACHB-17]